MIDVSVLKVLFDDDVMIRKYLGVFRGDVPTSLYELRESIKNLDWDNASITAHSLKSQLQYLKEDEVSKLAYEIEKRCEDPNQLNGEELHKILEDMADQLQSIVIKIDSYLSSN